MRRAAFLAGLALVAAPAATQEPQPQQDRIWKGTLGGSAITACFFDEDGREGVFYRDAMLEPVRLEAAGEAAPSPLREMRAYDDPTGALWSLTVGEDRITGEWRTEGEVLPIRLAAQAVTLSEYGTACETGAFLDPLLAGGTVTAGRESMAGTAYTVLQYAGPKRAGLEDYSLSSFALDPVRPGDAAINAALATALPDGMAASAMGGCFGSALRSGMGGYQDNALVPLTITLRWLGLRHSGSDYCGGAHPNHFILLTTYDRHSGAEVDTAAWFKPGVLQFYEFDTVAAGWRRSIAGLSPALLRALLARYPAREDGGAEDTGECADIIRDGSGWQIGLTREGPVFVPQLPHVAFACTEEIVLPWEDARPFLSAKGRAVMASLR